MDASDYKKNASGSVVNYWYSNGPRLRPEDITPGWISRTLTSNANSCLSNFSELHGLKMTEAQVAQTHTDQDAARTAYVNTAYVYNGLLDGGNTDQLVQEVQESWPQEAWDLRNSLMGKSPFLSTEVLVEMMRKNILPLAMVQEICLANPEATKKDDFVKWAEYEAPNPLPAYMIDQIAASWEPKTFRMELESTMGQHHADMTTAGDRLQAHFRLQEEGPELDQVLAIWQGEPSYAARYAEVQQYIRRNDFAHARNVLAELDAQYKMLEERVEERDRTLSFLDRLEALHQGGRTVMQMNGTEVADLEAFATGRDDQPAGWARNILCFGYDICLEGPENGESGIKRFQPVPGPEAATPLLRLTPNPATVVVNIAHHLLGELKEAHIRISDARGRELERLRVKGSPGQLVWDTRNTPAGVYTVELFNGGERLATERSVIQ